MARQSWGRIHLALLILYVLSEANAHVVVNSTQLPFLGRMDLPPICQPRSLEPAVECGCFLYYPQYRYDPYWDFLEDICLEELNGNILSGERSCSSSPYGSSYGSSIPRRSRNRIERRATQFFRDARRECFFEEESFFEHNGYSSTISSSTPNGGNSVTTSYSSSTSSGTSTTSIITFNGSGSRRRPNRRTSRAVRGEDSRTGLEGGANERASGTSLQSRVASKQISTRIDKGLKNFCLVVVRVHVKTKQKLKTYEKKCLGK